MYQKNILEKICYNLCKEADWKLSGLYVELESGVRGNETVIFKYAKNYLQKKLKENPDNWNFRHEYRMLVRNDLTEYTRRFSKSEMEKKCYNQCKEVNWEYNDLSSLDFCGIILSKVAIIEYAKRYMIKNEPDSMSLKEILFFMDHDEFLDDKIRSYYRDVVIEGFNKYMSASNTNFSFMKKHRDEFFIEAIKRYCYDYCAMHNWEYNKIGKLSFKNSAYDPTIVREFAREIMLRNEPDSMNLKEILFFMDHDEFFVKHQDMAKLILSRHEELKSIINYSWVKDNFKSVILKHCFDLCEKYQWDYQNITKYCDDNSINFHSLMELCIIYYQSISKEFEKKQNEKYQDYIKSYVEKYFDSNFCLYLYIKEYGQLNIYDAIKFMNQYKIKRENSDAKFVTLFDQLLTSNDQKEIINIIQTRKQYNYLKSYLEHYVAMYWGFCNGTDEIFISLSEKMNFFKSYLDENDKTIKQEILERAETIIKEYLSDEYYTIDKFCQTNNISKSTFVKYLNLLKDSNNQLFYLYTDKQKKLKNERYIRLIDKIHEIIKLFKSGIVENDKKREFDLLDYYSMTKLNFVEFENVLNESFSVSDYKALKSFFSKYKSDKELDSNDLARIYYTKTKIGVQVDAKGRVIPNSGSEVTLEEKKGIVRHLMFHNIPITNNTYNIAFRRWSKGMLNIDSQNVNDNDGKTI